jgi:hypothetical protein
MDSTAYVLMGTIVVSIWIHFNVFDKFVTDLKERTSGVMFWLWVVFFSFPSRIA